jgi:hypothetical protein
VRSAVHRRRVLLGIAALAASRSAYAAQCVEALKEIDIEDIRLRDYRCRGANNEVRVQILRLNDLATSALFRGRLPKRVHSVLNEPRIYKNEVFREFQTLISSFSTKVWGDGNNLEWRVDTPKAGKGINESLGSYDTFNIPTFGQAGDFPQPDHINEFIRQFGIPPDYRRYSQRFIWKYMTRTDIAAFKANVRSRNLSVFRNNPLAAEIVDRMLKPLMLIDFVTRNGWPEDFIVILGTLGLQGDGCEADFQYFARDVITEVAVLENSGSSSVTISSIRGRKQIGASLRPFIPQSQLSSSLAAVDLGIPAITLAPKEQFILPLRTSFIVGPNLRSMLDSEPGGQRPRQQNYVYGSEWSVSSLSIGGELVSLTKPSANFLALQLNLGEHSCPYLFFWSQEECEWILARKVIESANGPSKEATTAVTFSGLVSIFRLAELEPERACIKDINLTIRLNTGEDKALAISPENTTPHAGWMIYYGEGLDFQFVVPPELTPAQVVSSTLCISGYYERYSHLTSRSIRGSPPASPH